jgi:hypothetical protein
MFIFKRYYDTSDKVENETFNSDESSEDVEYIVDSKYIIMIDGEPVGFTSNKEEAFQKIKELIEGFKIKFILEGSKFYEDWNYNSERCIISSQDYNSFLSIERPRHIIRWKKITNNF